MKLCIPTQDDAGLAARISGHFGSTPWFTIVESETGVTHPVPNRGHAHRPGTCDAAGSISKLEVDAVVAAGLGRRAVQSLRAAGIPVYLTQSSSVGEAVEEFNMDILMPSLEDQACSGGQGFGCHH